jgi:integrase
MKSRQVFKLLIENTDSEFSSGESEMENHSIEDWLAARAESDKTLIEYTRGIAAFEEFCQRRGKSISSIVEDWRAAHYSGPREEQMFLDRWQDLIKAYTTYIKPRYAPLSQKVFLTVPKSFFSFWKIPLDVDLPRRACVLYHNHDLTKKTIRQILSKASQRDRAIFLLMAESGLRSNTVVNLKYWQIKEDYEEGLIPMRILTPASEIKDHVGDRWSFIGEDGVKTLKEYLEPRMPLRDQDYVFATEKPSRVKGEQFTEASLSTIFRRITEHLKMEKGSPFGKPGHYRMHGLRKYFRNNMKAEESFRKFWMGHSLGVDAHYISRDSEEHRRRYAQGYKQLRIFEQASSVKLTEIAHELKQKDKEILELKQLLVKKDMEIAELNAKISDVSPEKVEKIASAVFQKSWQDLVMKTLGTSAEEFKKQSKKRKGRETTIFRRDNKTKG